jgi:DNA-binding response OmpR family regulator
LERALRDSSLGRSLPVRSVRSLRDPEFVTAVHEAGLIVLHQDAAGQSLGAVCSQLRRYSHRPLLVLTRDGDEGLLVEVLAAGADDCLPAEASVAEVIARLRAQWRRDREYSAVDRGVTYEFQGVRLDTGTHEVFVGERRVVLTPKEFALLSALAAEAGRSQRREDLLLRVWGYSQDIATRTLDVHVGRLRQKIEPDPARPTIIITVPGVGYKLVSG